MKKEGGAFDPARRSLLAIAVGGTAVAAAGTAVAAMGVGTQPDVSTPTSPVESKPGGYRESEHVRKYYRTARL